MNLDSFFDSLTDSRRFQGQRYPLSAVLWMFFLGKACGYHSSRRLAAFIEGASSFFIPYFGLLHGVPCHVTLCRILTSLDTAEMCANFNLFVGSSVDLLPSDWVSGDGKALRSTVVSGTTSEQNFGSMVSLFCDRLGLTCALQDYQNKKVCEIDILRDLLPQIRGKGLMVTLDALHCQKKTAEAIVESGNDYMLQAKDNQPKLVKHILACEAAGTPIDTCTVTEHSRGTDNTWEVSVYEPTDEDLKVTWKNLVTLVVIHKWVVEKDGKYIKTRHLYISSRNGLTAKQCAEGIRGHWGIENKLHWVKDVILNEDKNKIENVNTASNMAVINTMAINFLRKNVHHSITTAQILFGQTFQNRIHEFRM